MNKTEFEARLRTSASDFERHYAEYFKYDDADTKRVTDAMRYSALAGGKRIRPFIVIEVCRMLGGDAERSLPLAAALECVHTYSLIHDDLPCMDNDDLRRGMPTCHKAYGEEFALLAGDGLLTYAFELIATANGLSEHARLEAIRLLSRLAGVEGMLGGQTLDLASEGEHIELEKLIKLHSMKTGALMRCAAQLGALCADADEKSKKAVDDYAAAIGLAFQVIDDILDVTADEKELGKPTGSDAQNDKVTFLSFMDTDAAKSYAEDTVARAKAAISHLEHRDVLEALADYIVSRRS